MALSEDLPRLPAPFDVTRVVIGASITAASVWMVLSAYWPPAWGLWFFVVALLGVFTFMHGLLEVVYERLLGAMARTLEMLPEPNPPGWRGPFDHKPRGMALYLCGYDVDDAGAPRPSSTYKEAILTRVVGRRKDACMLATIQGREGQPPPSDERCAELLAHLSNARWLEHPDDGPTSRIRRWGCYPALAPRPPVIELPPGTVLPGVWGVD